MKMITKVATMCLTMTSAMFATHATAQTRSQVWGGPLTQQAQTIYTTADVGLTTYESEAAGSKETKESSTFTIGGWAGEGREIGAQFRSSEAEVPFALNDSNMKTSFKDVRAIARIFWLEPFVTASLSEVNVTEGDTETIGIYSTGIGAGLGLGIALHQMLTLHAEASSIQSTKSFDKLDGDASLGRRDEGDMSLSFDVTDRMLDLLVGYRVRNYELESQGEKFNESTQGAYAGLRLGLYF